MPRLRFALLPLVVATALGSCSGDPTDVPVPVVPLALPLTDQIVFESNALDSLGDVFVMRIDGTDTRRLTGGDTSDACPALSPDGNWIAFLQTAAGSTENPSMILVKANGTQKLILGKFKSRFFYDCPVWSNDSRLVAFSSPVEAMVRNGNNPLVRTYDTSGNLIAEFTTGELTHYSFSPDNSRILYSTHLQSIGPPIEFQIESVKLDGSDRRRVTGGYSGNWSPDGTEIVFDTCAGQCSFVEMVTTCAGICVISPDGSTQRALTTSGRNPVISPTGDRVAYACGIGLCTVPTAGGEMTTVLGNQQDFIGPVWRPDGQGIGFVCTIGRQNDICIADLQTKIVNNLTHSPANEVHFSFSPRSSL